MPKFDVRIVETLTKEVTVDAENEHEALYKAIDGWRDEEYVLDSEDFCDVEFEVKVDGIMRRYDMKGDLRTG